MTCRYVIDICTVSVSWLRNQSHLSFTNFPSHLPATSYMQRGSHLTGAHIWQQLSILEHLHSVVLHKPSPLAGRQSIPGHQCRDIITSQHWKVDKHLDILNLRWDCDCTCFWMHIHVYVCMSLFAWVSRMIACLNAQIWRKINLEASITTYYKRFLNAQHTQWQEKALRKYQTRKSQASWKYRNRKSPDGQKYWCSSSFFFAQNSSILHRAVHQPITSSQH